jgi:hypothetical protein
MTAPPALPPDASAELALRLFESAGWRRIGLGDWSWVLASPDGRTAARITPFDPAYRMFAENCRTGAANRYLPAIDRIVPLRRDGYIVFMERLYPADPSDVAAFCAALGIASDSGAPPPAEKVFVPDADFDAVRVRVRLLLDEGARRFRLWGGCDLNPKNVMRDERGCLKLLDPVFIRGKAICDAILEGRRDALADFTRPQLEDFLCIPVFAPGPETDALQNRLRAMFGD